MCGRGDGLVGLVGGEYSARHSFGRPCLEGAHRIASHCIPPQLPSFLASPVNLERLGSTTLHRTPLHSTALHQPNPNIAVLGRQADMMQVPISDHYPIQLHFIKALFCQDQYRQCIQACRDLVKLAGGDLDDNPLHKTFVNFYLALCHDEIARLMHHNSVAKVPAFHSAQQYYQDAIDGLPSPTDVKYLCAQLVNTTRHRDSFFDDDDDDDATVSDFVMSPTISGYDPRDMGISRASSPILSSPPIFRRESLLGPPVGSPGTVTSDLDELESHDSFSELMTPNRVKRDASRMSLLGQPPKRLSRDVSRISLLASTPKALPRDASRMSLLDIGLPRDFSKISLHEPTPPKRFKSPTHSLMRPIRLGSPAKPHFLPPTLPYSGTTGQFQSQLPRLAKDSKTEPNLAPPRVDSRNPSPEPPLISPNPTSSCSDTSTISQASPRTPVRHQMLVSPDDTPREGLLDQGTFYRMTDHIAAMRSQLQRHIAVVQEASLRLQQAQQEKRMGRIVPTSGTPLGPIRARKDVFSSPAPSRESPVKPGLPQARSYWSFAPEDVKKAEKKRRIAAGRERGWKRERFQPGKYRELCERALEELV